jgi:ketosteroid isomerase-like protein
MSHTTTPQFAALMQQVARAWAALDADAAVACFTPDAVYMQPPNVQFYRGHDQLRAYFGALTPGTFLDFHNLWFDEAKQTGCVEFSFGVRGKPKADHGTIVVELRNGLIAHWREYVQKGPAQFTDFIAITDKDWQWHIGNYP